MLFFRLMFFGSWRFPRSKFRFTLKRNQATRLTAERKILKNCCNWWLKLIFGSMKQKKREHWNHSRKHLRFAWLINNHWSNLAIGNNCYKAFWWLTDWNLKNRPYPNQKSKKKRIKNSFSSKSLDINPLLLKLKISFSV